MLREELEQVKAIAADIAARIVREEIAAALANLKTVKAEGAEVQAEGAIKPKKEAKNAI